jgi:misacylated tRNA(Ala) deacylase
VVCMKEPLYLRDSYLKSWKTGVKSANGKFIVLEDTAFYPKSGGQPWDTGTMKRLSDGRAFKVVYAGKFSGEISHEVDAEGLKHRDEVECSIDWPRRYLFMRYHTAAHVLSGLMFRETGALITGNQIGEDKTRIDFSLDTFDRELFKGFEDKANKVIRDAHPVKISFISREEAEKNPDLSKLARGMDPSIKEFRVVDIQGFDRQLCGGTHVKSTSEIGSLRIAGMENKGKSNRRVYFTLG